MIGPKGVRLEVRGGKVVRATAGVLAANAKLSLHDHVLVERATPEFSAPTRIRFSRRRAARAFPSSPEAARRNLLIWRPP
jgi:hypothetical protein